MLKLLSKKSIGLFSLILFASSVAYGINQTDIGIFTNYVKTQEIKGNTDLDLSTATSSDDITLSPNSTTALTLQSSSGLAAFTKGLTVGSSTPSANTIFSVSSSTLPSRPLPGMSNTAMNAITPLSAGYGVFNLSANAPYWYLGSAWHQTSFIDATETLTGKSLNFSNNTATNIPLTTAVTGVLPIANGGTSNGSLAVTAGGALYTDGSKLVNIGAGVSGQVFTSGGSGAATWKPAGGAGSGINLLQNFNWNAELGATTNWTNSGGTFTVDSTAANVANGTYAFTFTASASGQTVLSNLTAIPAGLYGKNCLLEFYQKGFDGNMTAQVTDGTNVIATRVLTAASGYTLQDMNFICPSSGSLQMKLISTAASAQGWFDEVHLGSADNLAQVSQASLVGQIKITGCAGSWTTTSTTFADFGVQTGCVYTVLNGSGISAPSTMLPGLTFSSLAPGNYSLVYEGQIEQSVAGKDSWFVFTDGTTAATENSYVTSNSTFVAIPGIRQTISYSTPQTNVTLKIQAKNQSGGTAELTGTTASPGVISVYRFPLASQLAINPNLSPANWAATSTFFGSTTSTSYADPGSVTGAITLAGTPRNISCVANASGKLGIDCTLPKAGNYLVCYTGSATNNTTSDSTFSELTDGSGTVIVGEQRTMPGSGSNYTAIGSCGNYTASSTSVTLKVQLKVSAGTGQVNNMSFSIAGLDQALPAPYYVGSVVNQGGGILRIATVNMTAVCSSSPCTLAKSTGVSSVTRSAAGAYTVIFSPAFNGIVESCTVSTSNPNSVPGENCRLDNGGTSSSEPVFCNNSVTGTGTDAGFNITCFGDN